MQARTFPSGEPSDRISVAALAEFVHELKRPLSSIALPAELCTWDIERMARGELNLQEGLSLISKRVTYILNQARLTGECLDGLEELKIYGAPNRERILLPEVMRACMHSLEPQIHQAKATVDNRVPENLPAITGDPRQLKIAFSNLIANAVEAMTQTPVRRLFLDGRSRGGRVEITIQDTGPGISRENRTKIFDPHFSTKPGVRRGIGLSLVRQIVQAHRGKIGLSKKIPGGSCFQVIFAAA